MKIILDNDAAKFIYAKWTEWEAISKNRNDTLNWKRSPIERENRRESIVYGNCANDLCRLLRNAIDNNGEIWWDKRNEIFTPNKSIDSDKK